MAKQRHAEQNAMVSIPLTSLTAMAACILPCVVLAGFFAVGKPWVGVAPGLAVLLTLILVHLKMLRIVASLSQASAETPEINPSHVAELEDQVAQLVTTLRASSAGLPGSSRQVNSDTAVTALTRMVALRDPVTGSHLDRLREYTRSLISALDSTPYATEIAGPMARHLPVASMLHDIGKVGIPDSILLKPDRLTKQEFAVIKKHPTLGGRILQSLLDADEENEILQLGLDVTLYHHERWDGKGYPFGSAGTDIPLAARIVSLADVYDALTSERPYKLAYSHEATRAHIVAQSGSQFDPVIVDAFLLCEKQWEQIQKCSEQSAIEPETRSAVHHGHLRLVERAS